jgi:DnaK suppressor protein
MTPREYKPVLEARRASALAELRQAELSAAPVQLDQASQGRLSRMDAMQQQAMAMSHAQRLRTELRKVEAALDRLEAGTYGICCRCGEAMSPERLEADPAAPFCLQCVGGPEASGDEAG